MLNHDCLEELLIDRDGTDEGPAPLQNTEIPPESFEGVNNFFDNSNAQTANASMAVEEVEKAIDRIREISMSEDNVTATFDQPTVLPIDGFANMNNTPYSWAQAFPTIFMPHYIMHKGKYQWVILHDITGSDGPRDKSASINKWYEYQIWRSDGMPAAHPTFALVLHNHKIKNTLQKQGQYVVNTSDIDPHLLIEDIKKAKDDDEIKVVLNKLLKQAHVHAGNVPGTKPYWKNTRFEFKATNFYNSYIKKKMFLCFIQAVLLNTMNILSDFYFQSTQPNYHLYHPIIQATS